MADNGAATPTGNSGLIYFLLGWFSLGLMGVYSFGWSIDPEPQIDTLLDCLLQFILWGLPGGLFGLGIGLFGEWALGDQDGHRVHLLLCAFLIPVLISGGAAALFGIYPIFSGYLTSSRRGSFLLELSILRFVQIGFPCGVFGLTSTWLVSKLSSLR